MTLSSHTLEPETISTLGMNKLEDEVEDITQEKINTFKIYTSRDSKLSTIWPTKVECPGCLKIFPAKRNKVYHPSFYHHCIRECDKYKELGKHT